MSFDHVNYSVFGIARDLFYWELIFCVFCYSYSEIGINGIVLKERALDAVEHTVAGDVPVWLYRKAAITQIMLDVK